MTHKMTQVEKVRKSNSKIESINDIRSEASEKKSKIPNITTISAIADYVNNFRTKHLEAITELTKRINAYASRIKSPEAKEEFLRRVMEHQIFVVVNKILPVFYKIVGVEGSEVQMVLSNCIAKIQELMDRAKREGKLDGIRKRQMGAVMGALDELSSSVLPDTNELDLLSADSTHLHKMCQTIFVNTAKLKSLEREIAGEGNPIIQFQKVMDTLTDEMEEAIVRDYLVPSFNAEWIPDMDFDTKTLMLHKLVTDQKAEILAEPLLLVALFRKYKPRERQSFIEHLIPEITGNEKKQLLGEE